MFREPQNVYFRGKLKIDNLFNYKTSSYLEIRDKKVTVSSIEAVPDCNISFHYYYYYFYYFKVQICNMFTFQDVILICKGKSYSTYGYRASYIYFKHKPSLGVVSVFLIKNRYKYKKSISYNPFDCWKLRNNVTIGCSQTETKSSYQMSRIT